MNLPDELNADLTWILGRPNFVCGSIAHILRRGGIEIPEHAEEEQAHVLWWLLGVYVKHGADFRDEAARQIKSIIGEAKRLADEAINTPAK